MAGLQLELSIDSKDLQRLASLKGKARFAAVKALTYTAKDAQAKLKADAGGVFHLRNSWVRSGIRIDPATMGTMTARVGSIDKYMERHVIGASNGDKKPGSALSIRGSRDASGRLSSGGLLIRGYGSIGEVPTHNVVRRQLGRSDATQRKTFQILGKGGKTVLIVRRTTKKRKPLQVLGILKGEAHITAHWAMKESVSAVVGAKFGEYYLANLEAAAVGQ